MQAGRDAEQTWSLLWKDSPSREQTSGVIPSHPEKGSMIDSNTALFTTEGSGKAAWRRHQLSLVVGTIGLTLTDEVGQ